MSLFKRLILSAFPLVLFLVIHAGCSSLAGPKELTCTAAQQGCDLTCSGSDNCEAKCENPNGGCNLTCSDSSTCSCTGNVCNITCETSGSCTCSAGICGCTGASCKR